MTADTTARARLEKAFFSWVDGIKQRDQDAIAALVGSSLTYNGQEMDKKDYLSHVLNATSQTDDVAVDMLIVSSGELAVAARLIHQSSASGLEHPEYVFVHFSQPQPDSLQIASVRSLHDEPSDSPVARSPSPSSPSSLSSPPGATASSDLASFYQAYIDSINTLTMAEHFPRFCQPRVTHNARPLELAQYYAFIESSFEDIRGLHFRVVDLVADEAAQTVASRIEFTGRPVRPFRGVEPGEAGEEVKFYEHAFYFLEGGRIVRVWSVLDMDAYRRCLGR